MLDSVMASLASAPTAAATPVGVVYDRSRWTGRDVDYQAYMTIRDAILRRRPHDLTGAVERILARPHERLGSNERTVPLALADRIDGRAVVGILSRPEVLTAVPDHHRLAHQPFAVAMGGMLPERVGIRRPVHTTDTVENRFVRTVLEICLTTVRAVARAASVAATVASPALISEAAVLTSRLERWMHAPPLTELPAVEVVPATSTVLRGKAGYRDVLAFHSDLVGRTRPIPPRDLERLVGIRDSATIYEYWCYFEFTSAVADVLGEVPAIELSPTEWFGPTVQRQSQAVFPSGMRVLYNQTFSQSATSHHSYSVVFRPDITLELPSGERHLFDAKFAFEPGTQGTDDRDDDEELAASPSRARRAHLHKMHAYRDATGARSVWVLYPGTASEQFEAPGGAGMGGIGAIPFRLAERATHDVLRARLELVLAMADGVHPDR